VLEFVLCWEGEGRRETLGLFVCVMQVFTMKAIKLKTLRIKDWNEKEVLKYCCSIDRMEVLHFFLAFFFFGFDLVSLLVECLACYFVFHVIKAGELSFFLCKT